MFSCIKEQSEANKGELGTAISFWHTTQAIASAFFISGNVIACLFSVDQYKSYTWISDLHIPIFRTADRTLFRDR